MADVAHDLHGEFWQAPLPVQVSLEHPQDHGECVSVPACSRCGTEFMMDSRFCYACGTKRPADFAELASANRWTDAVSVTFAGFTNVGRIIVPLFAKAVRSTISALPSVFSVDSVASVRRQTGLGTASLTAFVAGITCCLVALFLGFSGSREPGTMMLAGHLERIEWLLGGTAAFMAGLLLKKPSGRD
jgi:hypothetical protein